MQNQTITEIAKIMERGLMVIPQKIRRMANITEGSYVRIILKNNEIVLKLLLDEEKKKDSSQAFKITRPTYTKQQGLKLLSRTKKYYWSKKDDQFLSQGRKQIADRLKKHDSL